MRTLTLALSVALAATAAGCGHHKDSDSGSTPAPAGKFLTPDYADGTYPNHSLGLDPTTGAPNVVALQTLGQAIAKIAASAGKITLDNGAIVALTQIASNPCPAGLSGCTSNSSSDLGIPGDALVESVATLQQNVRDQGNRNACVAFALDGAVELLNARTTGAAAAELSEQDTYFAGRAASGDWNAEGLAPAATTQAFVDAGTALPVATAWPFNAVQDDCTTYLQQNPGAYCSATEAQGGGADSHQPDPRVAAATAYRISEAHQLYASVGRVRQALAKGYPVVLAVNANIDFNIATKKKGVVSWIFKAADCGGTACGHDILAVGYHDDPSVAGGGYVVVKNSWGTSWGDAGLAYLTYEWLTNSILDAQAIVSVE